MRVDILTKKLIKLELVMKFYSRKRLSELGVYFGQLGIIGFIQHNSGCTQIDIANALSVSPASIALSTKRLEKAGFITKEIDENNLRCKRLKLTEKGEEIAKKAMEIRDEQDCKMYHGLSEAELLQFGRLLDKVTLNLTEEKENIVTHSIVRNLEKQLEELE